MSHVQQSGDLPPSLLFMREVGTTLVPFTYLGPTQVVNVVMHATTEIMHKLRYRAQRRVQYGESMAPLCKIRRAQTRIANALSVYSSSDPDSPFEHMRINAGRDGKILIFSKRNNIIRAGKHTPADAFNAVVKFFSWSQCNRGRWHTGIAAPNAVVMGQFKYPLSDKIRTSPYVTFSDKFPGYTINTAGAYAAYTQQRVLQTTCCIPEVYRSGKYIIPGIKTRQDLWMACYVLNKMAQQYCVLPPSTAASICVTPTVQVNEQHDGVQDRLSE
jgi:hypothetical protein